MQTPSGQQWEISMLGSKAEWHHLASARLTGPGRAMGPLLSSLRMTPPKGLSIESPFGFVTNFSPE